MARFDPDEQRPAPIVDDERRGSHAGDVLGHGTLACPRCDAPIALDGPRTPGAPTACPYCGHAGTLGSFVSLRQPTRPTRVVIQVRARGLRISRAR